MKTMKTTLVLLTLLILISGNAFAQNFPYITLAGHGSAVNDLVFSADGKTLISGGNDATIRSWEVSTGNSLLGIWNDSSNGRTTRSVYNVSLAPDEQIVASTGSISTRDGRNSGYAVPSLRLWEVSTGGIHWQRWAGARDVAFSPDGQTLASGGGTTIVLWEVSTGGELRTFAGHTSTIQTVAFSPDGQLLASGGHDNTIRLWETNTGVHLYTLTRHVNTVTDLAFSPDGQTVVSGSGDGTILLWDATTGRHLRTLIGHEDWVSDVAISPDGQTVVSGSYDDTIRLWEFSTGRHLHTLKALQGDIESVAFSPTEQKLASGHANGNIFLWNLPSTHVRIMPEMIVAPAVGQQFTIDINIVAGTDVKAYEAHLTFDPTALRHVSATNGDYLPAGAFFIPPVVSDNTVILSATAITGTSNGDGKLATVTFEVLDRSESFIDLPSVKLTDSKDRVAHPLAHSTKIEAFPLGDVNRDKTVNIQDLVLVAASFGQPVPEEGNPADVNGDGVINVIDLVTVAGALGNTAAAAPAVFTQARGMALTRADVQQWLSEVQALNLTDATAHRGIRFLEQLLAALTPKETALLANYPNPFNPETWIPYQLAESADVAVTIYATDGTVVRTLMLGHQPVGIYQDKSRAAYWDGRNAQGESVASGVYFYTLKAGEFSTTRKMLIRK